MEVNLNEIVTVMFPLVHGAVRQHLEKEPEPNLSKHCMLYAAYSGAVMEELGIKVRPVAGKAAWRVGPLDGDCVHHIPELGTPMFNGNFAYHVWIETEDGFIIDLTTQHLKAKLEELDSIDGKESICEWSDPFLVVHKADVMDLESVIQGFENAAYYCEIPGLIDEIMLPDEKVALTVPYWGNA